uniref:Uncharacterized protein n=1 Tax=Romanomermis culicivorax TaxID=13658 RepID=A0A915IKA6_ROMCU
MHGKLNRNQCHKISGWDLTTFSTCEEAIFTFRWEDLPSVLCPVCMYGWLSCPLSSNEPFVLASDTKSDNEECPP